MLTTQGQEGSMSCIFMSSCCRSGLIVWNLADSTSLFVFTDAAGRALLSYFNDKTLRDLLPACYFDVLQPNFKVFNLSSFAFRWNDSSELDTDGHVPKGGRLFPVDGHGAHARQVLDRQHSREARRRQGADLPRLRLGLLQQGGL